MTCVQLPNGFVMDLDSVHYIQSIRIINHPFTGKPTEKRELVLRCEGDTTVTMRVTKNQLCHIKHLVLRNIYERAGKHENHFE